MGNVMGCISMAAQARKRSPAAVDVVADDVEAALFAAAAELQRARLRAFDQDYQLGKLLGHGAFARVHAATHTKTGQQVAVKIINKAGPETSARQRDALIKEIAIMRVLDAHPALASLHQVYADDSSYRLVMELCTGGELFDKVIAKGHFGEREAASMVQSLLELVAFAHSKNVIHRDLKPENILFSDRSDGAQLKVVDFGTSDFCRPGQHLTSKFGTPYYVAPEVLQRHYALPADVWSCGVILYILLCGHPPFAARTDSQILAKVSRGSFSFAGAEWAGVSEQAKHLVSSMLVLEADARPTAAQLLAHPWFRAARRADAPQAPLGAHMVARLRAFAGMSRMKRLALVVLARSLTDRDVVRLRSLFSAMDADGDGRVTAEQLAAALQQVSAAVPPEELAELLAAAGPPAPDGDDDSPRSPGPQQQQQQQQQLVDYEEFIAAMLDTSKVARRANAVRCSFERLDRDGDGYITTQDLAHVLQESSAHPGLQGAAGRKKSLDLACSMFDEARLGRDSRLSLADFSAMLRGDDGGAAATAAAARPPSGKPGAAKPPLAQIQVQAMQA